jgi:DNA-binding MarR family transcriptional regulator
MGGRANSVRNNRERAEAEMLLLIRLLKLGSFINTPMKDGVCDPAGVSATELKVMMALAGEGALAGHDLVEIMGVPPMNVSRALAQLRGRGWIEQAIDPVNRRRKPVRLSAAGSAAHHGMAPDVAAVARALVGGLNPRQQRDFAALADVIIGRMADWIISHHSEIKLSR